ncbi:mini-chromosome maintenance complex-binding protein [Coccinella septempunctata]|uniref:mini-chromosome maintenance complex-binding protein n=1 Tax=Coccinella septempunctata TaxID=41139 RepID=UPI001D078ABE|nr:mini-chromosome maintenance complex-binding protein [Coccinella septempunctata]
MSPMNLTAYTPEMWIEDEENLTNLLQNSSWELFPMLNYSDLSGLREGQIVRFKGMVQDMRTPEYYLEKCVITNQGTKEQKIKHGKYLEFIKCQDNEVIDFYSKDTVRKELQTFYVISTPGENQWVKDIESKKSIGPVQDNPPANTSLKRSLDDETTSMMDVDDQPSTSVPLTVKRQCNAVPDQPKPLKMDMSTEYLLNFPVEDKNGRACLVKMYKSESDVKLNEVYEFIGFLSVDPKLSHEIYCGEESEGDLEDQVHNPPPSLIPRIHCVTFRKSKHGNPLVGDNELDKCNFEVIRRELLIALTQLLLGDEVAAEYLLYHMISEVYVRKDVMALGKFSLNLSNIPMAEDMKYVEKLYEFVQLLVPKSVYFPLTVESINEKTFIPKKDYDSNRLNSGLLQLSANTSLVLDETKLQPGKLDQAGITAVRAIAKVINTQTLSYDFNYYPVDFECDIKFLITSEGKSLLPSDCHVVLQPNEEHLATFNEIIVALKHFLKPELLNECRKYLSMCKLVAYEIEENMHTFIQEKFVEMRQKGETAEDLHNILVLNRLICLSYGKNAMNADIWERACKLEEKRKQRISS